MFLARIPPALPKSNTALRALVARAPLSTWARSLGRPSRKRRDPQWNTTAVLGIGMCGALAASGLTATTLLQEKHDRPTQRYESPRPNPVHGPESHQSDFNTPPPRPDLPTINLSEVKEHCTEESMWFTYRGAVYDLTDFLQGHPGGTYRMLMAAGSDLEPFWEIYRQHFRGHVVGFMERHRIGNLSPEESKLATAFEVGDIYETDPIRDPNLLPCTSKPFNGEPRIELLTEDYRTPNELFYVRNHLSCPDIDADDYVLVVRGKGMKKHKFTLEDIKTKFPKYEVDCTLQCAGNRREDMHGDRRMFFSPHWVAGAISNARWGGARMRDVLRECGLDVDGICLGRVSTEDQKFVHFEGYDTDETGFTYGCAIPIDKAVDALGDALFAYEMNRQPLPRDHGFPLRAICPGMVGNVHCKWLRKVIVSNKGSSKPYQCKAYRVYAPHVNFETDLADFKPCDYSLEEAPIVYEMPVQSMVCNPPQNSVVGMKGATEIALKGVAYSGGGRKIDRVDVSLDGGRSFTTADLHKLIVQGRNRHWAWTQFTKTLPLPEDVRGRLHRGERVDLDIFSNAMNSDFNFQPERMIWNARGVCVNHWYHVKTTLDPSLQKGTVRHGNVEDEFGNTPSGGRFAKPWGMHGFTIDPEHQSDPRSKVAPEAYHF